MPSMEKVVEFFEVPKRDDEISPTGTSHWLINRDIIPLPPARRTWGPWSFVGLWMLTAVNISGWTSASSLLALGLNVWQAMLVVIIGELLVALCVVGNGFVGAQWHIPFPVYNRFVWGMFGSILPLLMRIMLSFVWYACQLWFGGQSVKVVIGSIWPSFYTMKNTLPESAAMETNDFVAFIIFTVISLPLIYVPPEYYRKPFLAGSISITITAGAIFIWALAKEGGGGPMLTEASKLSGVVAPTGGALGWAFVYGINTVLGGICAGILNQSDYTRFAVKPTDQIYSQAIIVPVASSLTAFVGIIVTSCAAGFYPDDGLLWAPYALLQSVQMHGGPGARAAVFFAGCAFVLAQFGINVAGNAISGGIDLSGLFPRFLNIRRGAYLTSAIGIAICPWQLLNRPSTFLTVLSSFSVFLGPLTGCMISDYIIVRKWKLKLTDLYKANPESIYWFYYGVNPRVVVAWVMGVWPLMPGFIAAVSPGTITVSPGWTHLYQMAYPLGFVISATLHITFSKIWPPRGLGEIDAEDYFGTFGPKTAFIPGIGETHASSEEQLDEKDVEAETTVTPV